MAGGEGPDIDSTPISLPSVILPTQSAIRSPEPIGPLRPTLFTESPKTTMVGIPEATDASISNPPPAGPPVTVSILLASSPSPTPTVATSIASPATQAASPLPSTHSGLSTGKLVAAILPPVMVVLVLAPVLTIAFLEWRRKRKWRKPPKLSISPDTRLLGPRQNSVIFPSPSPSPFVDEDMREIGLLRPQEKSSPETSRAPSPTPPSLFTPTFLPGRQSLYSAPDPPPPYASQPASLQPPESFGRVRTRSHSSLNEANLSALNGPGVRFPFADGESDIVSEISFERGSGITIRRARDPDEISFVSAMEPDEQMETDPHQIV
ncbi:hypothetical protein MMC20_006330 [Loxospora ochrophaea]|nr:hypothetical protein [Loxospora ochrophaea]